MSSLKTALEKKQSPVSSAVDFVAPRLSGTNWTALFVCSLPSILLLLFVPPTFNMRDSATLLCTPLNYLVPHWPPLYPVFLLLNTSILGYTDTAIHSILICQHLLAISAAYYLATAVAENWKQILLAVFVCIGNYFQVLTHGLFTESLSNAFLVIFIGSAIRLCVSSEASLDKIAAELMIFLPESARKIGLKTNSRNLTYTVSFAAIVLSTLTRHNMFIFACLLPCFYFLRALLFESGKNLKHFALTLFLGLIAFEVVSITNTIVCKFLGTETTPLYGRAAVCRVHYLPWDKMPEKEKTHLLNNIRRRCPDDLCRLALTIMINDKSPWKGTYDQIAGLIPQFNEQKSVDQVLNDTTKAFFLTPNKYLLNETMSCFKMYMGENAGAFQSFVQLNDEALNIYRTAPDVLPTMRKIGLIQRIDPQDYKLISRVINPQWFDSICHFVPIGVIAAFVSIFAVVWGRAPRKYLALTIALLIAEFLYAFISSYITVVVPRYLLPVNTIAWITLALAILSFQRLPWRADTPGKQE